MYMLDTNICIYIIKKRPESVFEKFKTLGVNDLFISSIVLSELEYGVQKSNYIEKNKLALEIFLSPINIIPYTDIAAEIYGEIRSNLEKTGNIIGPMDLLIAAHALAENKILITNNEKEFMRISDLKIENWVN